MSADERVIVAVELCELIDANGDSDVTKVPWTELRDRAEAAIAKLPESQRASVYIAVKCYGEYARAYVELGLDRPETDAEFAARRAIHEKYAAESEASERAYYARLKAKYERP